MIQLNFEIFSSETCQPNFGFYLWFIIPHWNPDRLEIIACDNQATNGRDIICLSPGKVSVKIVSADNEILYLPHMK